MEHVVFFHGSDGSEQYRRAAGLEEAVRHVEHLRNTEGLDCRVYSLTEVPLKMKTVYVVELPGADIPATAPAAPVVEAPVAEAPPASEPLVVTEPVEASMSAEPSMPEPVMAEPVMADPLAGMTVPAMPEMSVPEMPAVPPMPEEPVLPAEPALPDMEFAPVDVPAEPVASNGSTGTGPRGLGFFAR